MRIQIKELRTQWKKLEEELQNKPIKSKRKKLNINSKISELENRKKKTPKCTALEKAKQDITTDRKEIKTSLQLKYLQMKWYNVWDLLQNN